MTAQEFIDWVQKRYQLPNQSQSIAKAAAIMKITENSIYKWRKGEREMLPSMEKLMTLIVENDELKEKLKNK